MATVVPLLSEWREPGAFEAIADGLLLEVAQDGEAVRIPGFVPPTPDRPVRRRLKERRRGRPKRNPSQGRTPNDPTTHRA
jgi:hypothetical protein